MTFSRGGTIFLEGKTFNISQINSVHIGKVEKFPTGGVWGLWFVIGLICLVFYGSGIWVMLTIISFVAAIVFSSQQEYAVFFDMSSGTISAYRGNKLEDVERIRDDIIRGLEEGYFPNYLRQGR